MDDPLATGHWLLLDAAGPVTLTGIVHQGHWAHHIVQEKPFLEHIQGDLKALMEKSGFSLQDLSGIVYAAGPGSTLGLRLAALLLRSLQTLPGLSTWPCLCYNNLALATMSMVRDSQTDQAIAYAPWRRDRLHRARHHPDKPGECLLDAINPEDALSENAGLFLLGNRVPRLTQLLQIKPYPAEKIPILLRAWPRLLQPTSSPTPYLAEEPEFSKWISSRHPAQ